MDALFIKSDDDISEIKQTDPAYALADLKSTLLEATKHKDDSTSAHLPSYLLELFTEYTESYLTAFLHSAFNTDMRSEKGWSSVHAIDLRGEWVDIDFWNSQVSYIDGNAGMSNEEEETFASLTVAFSGTAAVLQSKTPNDSEADENYPLLTSPTIDRSLLRIAMKSAFSPPDGPYQFLSHVITSSMEDRLYSVSNVQQMEKTQVMEHDAALILSGGRDAHTRMDLDLFPTAEFVNADSIYVAAGNGQAEKKESIAVFLQGCYLVLFIGGFYIYASYRYRRNHLKWELGRYGNKDAILFKHKYKRARGQRLINFISGRQNKSKDTNSITVEIDGVDGFFERELSGVDSSDDDIYDSEILDEKETPDYRENPQDLEKGLRESYNESTRNKKGLDMNPIDAQSIAMINRSTMKAVDDEHVQQNATVISAQPPKIDWNDVLENVVPIPASDAVAKLDDYNPTYRVTNRDGTGILVQRRYVQPASPFDVLYGAAFLHGEADRVEAQRRLDRPKKKKIRASPSGRKRKKKKKTLTMKLVTEAMNGQRSKDAIQPMMTIAEAPCGIQDVFNEEEEDDHNSDEEENTDPLPDLAQFTPGELRHNPSSMSFYSPGNFMRNLSEKYNLGLFDQSSGNSNAFEKVVPVQDEKKECDDIAHEDYPIEEGVVFCDFPRQDGTPCIIYHSEGKGGDGTDQSENAKPTANDLSLNYEENNRVDDLVSSHNNTFLHAHREDNSLNNCTTLS